MTAPTDPPALTPDRSGAAILERAHAHRVIEPDELPGVLAAVDEARNGPLDDGADLVGRTLRTHGGDVLVVEDVDAGMSGVSWLRCRVIETPRGALGQVGRLIAVDPAMARQWAQPTRINEARLAPIAMTPEEGQAFDDTPRTNAVGDHANSNDDAELSRKEAELGSTPPAGSEPAPAAPSDGSNRRMDAVQAVSAAGASVDLQDPPRINAGLANLPPLMTQAEAAMVREVRRPPYGETDAPFSLESARAMLANLEHEPPDQMNSDSLWVELRLACDEVERLTAERDEARSLADDWKEAASRWESLALSRGAEMATLRDAVDKHLPDVEISDETYWPARIAAGGTAIDDLTLQLGAVQAELVEATKANGDALRVIDAVNARINVLEGRLGSADAALTAGLCELAANLGAKLPPAEERDAEDGLMRVRFGVADLVRERDKLERSRAVWMGRARRAEQPRKRGGKAKAKR